MWTVIVFLYGLLAGLAFFTLKGRPSEMIIQQIKQVKKLKEKERRKGLWQIPGPASWPLIGTKWIYFWRYKMSKIHEAYEDLHHRYGPIVLEQTGSGVAIVNLFDRDDIEKVLRYPSRYPFRPPTEIVAAYRQSRPDRYASVGLINAQGEEWHALRTRLTADITSPRTLLAFLPTLNEICDDFKTLLRARRDPVTGLVENFQDLANLMGLEAICSMVLGQRLGFLSKDSSDNRFKSLAVAVKNLFILQRDAYFGNGMWKYVPTKTYREFARNEEIVYDIVSSIVDEALDKDECDVDETKKVFLSILKADLDIREKKSGIIDFITAGIETLAHTLAFVFYYLSKNPECQERIFKEFEDCSSVLTNEDLSTATYTKACIQENYRLSPTAFCIARIIEEDTTLSDYDLKAGTFVLCQTMIACSQEENFPRAKEFIPERWLGTMGDQNQNTISNSGRGANLVLPFGIGRRTCPGRRYVEIELTLIVAKLIREFKIEFIGELDKQFEFLIAPKTPVNIIFKDR